MPSPDASVASLVLDHPAAARILQKHRIDFCCRGERSLGEACAARGISVHEVLAELNSSRASGTGRDSRSLTTPELIDHIVEQHHGYLRETLPFVLALASKVARVHGDANERLRLLDSTVRELADTLQGHLEHEEESVFPALRANHPDASGLLQGMIAEHERVGELIWSLRAAADDYRVPDWACRSYRALFTELARLEYDVLRHVHLENHVLRPRFLPDGSAG